MYLSEIIKGGATIAEPVVEDAIKYLASVFELDGTTENVLKTTAVRLYCVSSKSAPQ